MRAPLTGMIFLLELTHDLNALPVLLVGSVSALCVTVLLLRRSILTEKLARRGQHITREYAVDVFELIRVGDVMDRQPPLVPADTTVADLNERISEPESLISQRQATLITENGKLAGIVTRGDLLRAQQTRNADSLTVIQAGSTDLTTAFADETLDLAINKMLQRNIGRLPVVDREDPRKVVGYLGRAEILTARMRRRDEEHLRGKGPLLARSALKIQ